MTLDGTFQFIMSAIWAVAVFSAILTIAALMTWVERKLSAMIQDRIGPNRANIRIPYRAWLFGEKRSINLTLIGLIHIIADPVKLFMKEDFVPRGANKFLHTLGPMIGMFIPFVVFSVIPFAGPLHIAWKDIPAMDLCLLTRLFPDGWSMQASDLWFIGGFFQPGAILTARDFSPIYFLYGNDVLHLSNYTLRFVVADLDAGMIFVFAVSSLAVYSVILAGWSSNNKFSFLGAVRGANQMISYEVALGVTLIGIFMIYGSVSLSSIVSSQGELLWGVVPKWGIFTQPLAFLLFFACGMAEIKRVPFDLPEGESEIVAGHFTEYSSMKFTMFMFGEFVEMILLSAVITTIFLGGWQIPGLAADGFHWWFLNLDWTAGNLAGILVVLLQAAKFMVFLILVLYMIFMARWTFPRFRYDQVMRMGWKMILPLGLANIMVTGVVLAVIRGWF